MFGTYNHQEIIEVRRKLKILVKKNYPLDMFSHVYEKEKKY